MLTFLSPQDEKSDVQLAITSVLPRQVSENLQPIRVVIQQSEIENRWLIQQIVCYDSFQGKDEILNCADEMGIKVIQSIIQEFEKYDVEVNFV